MLDGAYAVLGLIQQDSSELPLWLTKTQVWAEIVWRGATVLGIVAGGFFAYYKFIRGREFSKRVEPKLSAGKVIRRHGMIYLQVEASAKNIGLSKVEVEHDYTYILVETREWGAAAEWTELEDLYDVFIAQETLEPGEVAGEPVLIEIPEGNYLAIRLTLGFAASRDSQWWAISIVNLAEEVDNEDPERPR